MTPTAGPAQGDHRATYREVLAEPRFRLLFSTRTVAITADALRITTFSVLVFSSTGSALLSAVAFGIGFIPQLFGSLLLGSLADRLPPRALITGGYALTCATALLLVVVRMPVAASLGVVALVSLATPVFHGASSRLVAQSLKGDAYVVGRSLSNIASAGAQVFGLALGGAAVAALGPRRALAVSAVLYLGCALAVRLRLPRLRAGENGGTPGSTGGDSGADGGGDCGADGGAVRASLRGAGLLLRDRTVRRLMVAQWLPVAFVAGAEGLIVAYAGERGFAPGRYAVLMGCLPVGMLVGDLLVGRFLRPRNRERLVVPLVALAGLPLLGFAAEPGVGVSSCLLLLSGLGYAYGLGLQRPFLDALPEDGQGQAFGLIGSGSMTLQGVGPVCLGAVAAAGTGTGGAIALAGGAVVLTAGWIRKKEVVAAASRARRDTRQRASPVDLTSRYGAARSCRWSASAAGWVEGLLRERLGEPPADKRSSPEHEQGENEDPLEPWLDKKLAVTEPVCGVQVGSQVCRHDPACEVEADPLAAQQKHGGKRIEDGERRPVEVEPAGSPRVGPQPMAREIADMRDATHKDQHGRDRPDHRHRRPGRTAHPSEHAVHRFTVLLAAKAGPVPVLGGRGC
ncbi:hypothetical protein SFIMM107S_05191 [Streptomyces griseus]